MYLTKEIKEEIFAQHGENKHRKTEGQIALFTFRITHLTEHLKKIVTIITQSVH
jgi:small subunit ribosomal protein S15